MNSSKSALVACLALFSAFAQICGSEPVADKADSEKRARGEMLALAVALAPIGESHLVSPDADLFSLIAHYEDIVIGNFLDRLPASDIRAQGARRFSALLHATLDGLDFVELEQLARRGAMSGRRNRTLEDYYGRKWIAKEVAAVCADAALKPAYPELDYTPTSEEFTMARFSVPALFESPNAAAIRYFARLCSPVLALRKTVKSEDRSSLSEQDMWKAIRHFPYEQPGVIAAQVTPFSTGSWCGTGDFSLAAPRQILALKCLLRERKVADAVVASFRVPSNGYEQWKVDLLTFAGLDWEEAMLAARDFRFLAAAGSNKGARLALAESDRDGHGLSRFESVASFLISGPESEWGTDDRRRWLAPEIQSSIFAEFDNAMRLDAPMTKVHEALGAAESLRRIELRPSLRRLLAYPAAQVARRAAAILRQLGDDVPEIALQPDAAFVLKMNGKVWSGAEVAWEIVGMGRSQFMRTGKAGEIAIPRDDLLDPAAAGKSLRFSFAKATQPQIGKDGVFGAAWIQSALPIPPNGEAPTIVELSVVPLPFRVTLPSAPTSPVVINLVGEHPFFDSPQLSIPPSESTAQKSAVIKWVSPGKYRLRAASQGFSQTMTEFFEVKDGMQPIPITLTRGVSVVCKIGARNWNHRNIVRLFANGSDVSEVYAPKVDDEFGTVRIEGIPAGDYQLRVLSTQDTLLSFGYTEVKVARELESGMPISFGAVRDFRIGDEAGEIVDLGLIETKSSEPLWREGQRGER